MKNTNTLKSLIWKINHEENWEKQQGMLEMLNTIYGTAFGFLNREVVWFEDPSIKHLSPCHDAYLWADALEAKWNNF